MNIILVTHGTFFDPEHIVSGNSIRSYYLAKGLVENGAQLTYVYPAELAQENQSQAKADALGIAVESFADAGALHSLVKRINPHAIIVGYWELLEYFSEPYGIPIIADLIAPRLLEALFEKKDTLSKEVERMLILYRRADRFLCGTERQKLFLIPWLIMAGFDCRFELPIDVIPISMEANEPRVREADEQRWHLVSGGVSWPWRRSEQYIEQITATLEHQTMNGELLLLSGRYVYHDEQSAQDQNKAEQEQACLKQGPLLPYGQMERLFREQCDIGIELSDRNVERDFSFSFRVVEFLRCGLPVICNDSLEIAALIRRYDAGWVISSPQEVAGLLQAIAAAPQVYAEKSRSAIKLVDEQFNYHTNVLPLIAYLQNPKPPQHSIERFYQPLLRENFQELGRVIYQTQHESSHRFDTLSQQLYQLKAEMTQHVSAMREDMWKVQTEEINGLKEQVSHLQQHKQNLDEQRLQAEARISELLHSHSWRITSPFRVVHTQSRRFMYWLQERRQRTRVWISDLLRSCSWRIAAAFRALCNQSKRLLDWLRSGVLRICAPLQSIFAFFRHGLDLFLEAWRQPTDHLLEHPVDGAVTAARADGRYIVVVTRKDLFPTYHGAAVKIIQTARGLSHLCDGVFVITGDWARFFLFRDGRMQEHYFPRLVRLGMFFSLRAAHKLHRMGMPYNEAPMYYPAFDWGYLLRLFYLARRYRFALYLAEFPIYARPCLRVRRWLSGTTMIAEHNVEYRRIKEQYPEISDNLYRWLKAQEIELCNAVDHVIVVSRRDGELLAEAGVDKDKIHLVSHGVDLQRFDHDYELDPRAQHQLPADIPLLVYHGIYSYYPNYEAMLVMASEILPRLEQRGVRVKVLAIGPDKPEHDLHPDIVFTGAVDNLAPYLKSADLAVVPLQQGGGTRMKILEYFAARVAVVSTAKGIEGIPVTNGEQALIVDSNDAIADAVCALLADREKARALAEQGREFVKTLDWNSITRRYVEIAGLVQNAPHCSDNQLSGSKAAC